MRLVHIAITSALFCAPATLAHSASQEGVAFMACVHDSIPKLDDGITPANIVTNAVVMTCLPIIQFPADCQDVECQDAAIARFTEKLTPLVLEYRVSKKNRQTP